MNPVSTISGKAYPFGLKNVDTDVIIPAAWLKTISRSGLGKGAFEALRKEPGNLFDSAEYAGSRLMEVAKTDPIHIDLENQVVTTPFQDRFTFEIDPFRKHCLLNGLDEIGLTLASSDAISAYESRLNTEKPWLTPQMI